MRYGPNSSAFHYDQQPVARFVLIVENCRIHLTDLCSLMQFLMLVLGTQTKKLSAANTRSRQGMDNDNGHSTDLVFKTVFAKSPKHLCTGIKSCFPVLTIWLSGQQSPSTPCSLFCMLCFVKCYLVLSQLGMCRWALGSFFFPFFFSFFIFFFFFNFSFFSSSFLPFFFLAFKKADAARQKWTGEDTNQHYKKAEEGEKRITQTQTADVFSPLQAANMMDTTLHATLASVKDWECDEGQEPWRRDGQWRTRMGKRRAAKVSCCRWRDGFGHSPWWGAWCGPACRAGSSRAACAAGTCCRSSAARTPAAPLCAVPATPP